MRKSSLFFQINHDLKTPSVEMACDLGIYIIFQCKFKNMNGLQRKFRKVKGSCVWRNDKCISAFWEKATYRPGICVKYFLSFPQKNLSPEKAETNQVFTFQFLKDKIYSYIKKKPFGNLVKLPFWSILSFKNWKVNT